MQWLALFNPRAGYHIPGDGHALSTLLHRKLGAHVARTCSRKHAWHVVRQNWSYDGFIAVGGDGTISEVVNGLNINQHSLGIIPVGTGNDLAQHLGIQSVGAALKVLSQGCFQKLDMISVRWLSRGMWRQRYLVTTSGIGYLAGATEVAELPFKRWGAWIYAAAAVVQSFRQTEFRTRLSVDNGPFEDVTLTTLIVNNSQCIGRFRLFPEALLNDGKLNLLFGRLKPRHQLLEDLGVLTHTHAFERATRLACRYVDVLLAVPGVLTAATDSELKRIDPVRESFSGDPLEVALDALVQSSEFASGKACAISLYTERIRGERSTLEE